MKRKLWIALYCLFLTSCTLQPVPMPHENTYSLTAISEQKQNGKPTDSTLLIMMPSASPAYQNAKIAYALQPYQLRYYAYNRWVAPPAEMLEPLLAESFRNSNYFQAVVTAPFAGATTFRLDTQLLDFKQEFNRKGSTFKMDLHLTLTNNKNEKIIFSRSFQASVKAPSNTPQGGVIAANQATQAILQQAVAAIIRSLN